MTEVTQVTDKMKDLLDESLQILDLSVRTINGLENADGIKDARGRVTHVTTIKQLLALSKHDLLSKPGFGEKTVQEILAALSAHGFDTRRRLLPVKAPLKQSKFESKFNDKGDFAFGGRRTALDDVSTNEEGGRKGRARKRRSK